MKVSALRPSDAPAVADVSASCFETPWTVADLEREIARDVARACAAWIDGVVVGYGVAYVIAGEAEVLTLGVEPDHRGRGVGRRLLCALVEGCERAHLEVRADNRAACALYERSGFERVSVRSAYYGDGQDALLMAWTRPSSP